MTNAFDTLKNRDAAAIMSSYGRYPLAVSRAEGCRLFDLEGREYLDLLAGVAVTSLGHCHPEIADALCTQARILCHVSNLFYQPDQVRLAEELIATWQPGRVFYCNSGAEANEGAIKLARRFMRTVKNRDAYEIITLTGSFHGRTLATVTATGQTAFREHFHPLPGGFKSVEAGDIEAMKQAITEKTAMVLVEIVQGEGGVNIMSADYLTAIQNLCREHDILFGVDEIQTGLCRTGRFWAHQHYGLRPNIVTCAKALGNGFPIGAVLADTETSNGFTPGSHATTFGGSGLATAAALKTLEIMKRDKIAERAEAMGKKTLALIDDVMKKHPDAIDNYRGLGLMIGIELKVPGLPVWQKLLDRGFVCNLAKGKVLRLIPPLIIEEDDIARFTQALSDILDETA
ncbi:aspartate aminotransferase family protein [Desulfovibrio inopinatus]|uniref:aspartate aminotransferase family protein n=1 Tax=Desulfovibrio inopinatus TaxID=102109 RepID=UPI00040E1C73|nr:aspartate aminotransferase family protein [Desulfovibrio inopinatus]